VFLTRGSTAGGIEIPNNTIVGNDNRGVENGVGGVVDARSNYWGASDGPSSSDDSDAPYEDPVTSSPADGSGDAVSANDTLVDPVSNARFDPFLSRSPGDSGPAGPGSLPQQDAPARDPGADGLYEDINGDGRVGVVDVAILLDMFGRISAENEQFVDFNDDGRIDIVDVATLLDRIP